MINVKFLQYLVPVDATVVVLLNIIVEAKELTDVIVFDAVLYGVVKDSVKSVLTDALSVAVAFVVEICVVAVVGANVEVNDVPVIDIIADDLDDNVVRGKVVDASRLVPVVDLLLVDVVLEGGLVVAVRLVEVSKRPVVYLIAPISACLIKMLNVKARMRSMRTAFKSVFMLKGTDVAILIIKNSLSQ